MSVDKTVSVAVSGKFQKQRRADAVFQQKRS